MMRFRILLAWSLAAVSPLSAQPLAATLRVPYVIDTLPNGLTLIVHEDHSVPIVTAYTWFHVGSGDELPGRTGFAHLFEHLMFMGSEHAPYPQFDRLLEAAGASNNGSTDNDRTNYFEQGPVSALPLMLWLDADRMGWLLPTMDSAKVDLQRDVVKNERRQSVENQPYGLVEDVLPGMLYPPGHPYSWTVIGSMKDLSAASLEDVKNFFRTYYAPNNAVVVVASDVKAADVKALVWKYFADIPRGPETTSQMAGQVGTLLTFGLPFTWFDDYVRRIMAVTALDVQRVAREYIRPDAMTVVIVDDIQKVRSGIERLGFGPVEVRKP